MTLLSRIAGMIRDIILSYYLGAGLQADAFLVAFRIPNTLRRLFGEGSLTPSLIPVYTEVKTHQGQAQANRMASHTLNLLVLTLLLVVGLGIWFAPQIIWLFAKGFASDSAKMDLTVGLTRWMFPYLIMIGLASLFMGILHVQGHFAAPAFTPVLLNISMILGLVGLGAWLGNLVYGLVIGVLLGGVGQCLILIPFLRRHGFRYSWGFNYRDPGVRKVFALMAPSILGLAVYQLNILVGTRFSSYIEGGNAYLYYADRLMELPLGLFAFAIGTVVFPAMSQAPAHGKTQQLCDHLNHGLRLTAFFIIPCSVGLVVLRDPLVRMMFYRGSFLEQDVVVTAQTLGCFIVGLWAIAGVKILASAFYSLKDTKTPVFVAVGCLIVNAVTAYFMVQILGQPGVALAISVAAVANFLALWSLLHRKFRDYWVASDLLKGLLRMLMTSLAMGFMVHGCWKAMDWQHGIFGTQEILMVLGIVGGGAVVFLVLEKLFQSPELEEVLSMFKRRFS